MLAAYTRYPDGTTLRFTGIIYLHRITDNRMSGSAYRNLQIFGRLCGNLPLRRARLVTTMWDIAKDHPLAGDREKQLVDEFWQPLTKEGATVKRFYNTSSSSSQIIDELIDANIPKVTLLLQEELIEQQKHLNETEAGRAVYSRLQALLAEQRRMLKQLADEAKLQNDPDLARSLQEEYDEIGVQLQNTLQEMEKMRISLPRRFILWLFSLGKSPGVCSVSLMCSHSEAIYRKLSNLITHLCSFTLLAFLLPSY